MNQLQRVIQGTLAGFFTRRLPSSSWEIWWMSHKMAGDSSTLPETNKLLMEEILHQLIGFDKLFIPLFTRSYTSQVVQDFFHQQRAPKDWCLEDDPILLGFGLFSGASCLLQGVKTLVEINMRPLDSWDWHYLPIYMDPMGECFIHTIPWNQQLAPPRKKKHRHKNEKLSLFEQTLFKMHVPN